MNYIATPKMSRLLVVILGLCCSLPTMAQPGFFPTDNPYNTRYNKPDHWTRNLRWSNVVEADQYPGLVVNGNVDSTVLATAMNGISTSGGGVLFFGAGTYRFNFSIELPSGVILRGETPSVSDALDTNFVPPTRFEFPHYVPTFSGAGTPNSSAFKHIGAVANASNLGVVNVDIDGASIGMHPHQWQSTPTRRGNTMNPVDVNANVLIFGVRSNNTATPDPQVPTLCQENNNGGWQRWVWSFSSNVDLFVNANGVVANCRFNDNPSMSFNQPGYFYGDGANCTPSSMCDQIPADGSGARFDVTAHYAVVINRAKLNKDGPIPGNFGTGRNNPNGIYAWITYGEPDTEPFLFKPGNEVRDCWMYKINRIGIQAAGNGLVVLNNKILDKVGKQVWISPMGTRCNTNNAATFENRGIDISGWNVQVSYNNVMVEQAVIRNGPYPTVDGEGILVQECCGGSSVKDYVITHNLMQRGHTGYIGLWAMRDIVNTRIDSNALNCEPIILWADYAGSPVYFRQFNNAIKGNTDVTLIDISGTAGGANVVVENNTSCGSTPAIKSPCYVTIGNNTGFTSQPCTTTPNLTVPAIVLSTSSANRVPMGSTAVLDWTVQDADSVRLWRQSSIELPYSVSTTQQHTVNLPTPGVYEFTVEGKNTAVNGWSNTVTFYVEDTTTITTLSKAQQLRHVSIAPNPVSERLKLTGLESDADIKNLEITDLMGRVVKQLPPIVLQNGGSIQVQELQTGVYTLQLLMTDGSRATRRFVKQ